MTFAQRLTHALAKASDTDSVRTNLSSAFTTFETAVKAQLVTQAGKDVNEPEYVQVQEHILELALLVADTVADYS